MASNSTAELVKQMKRHEVAVGELKSLPASRVEKAGTLKQAVYQKNGNIFFKTNLEKATTFEQRQLDAAKVTLERSALA